MHITQGWYSRTTIEDIHPLDIGNFLAGIGGFWSECLLARVPMTLLSPYTSCTGDRIYKDDSEMELDPESLATIGADECHGAVDSIDVLCFSVASGRGIRACKTPPGN